MKIMISSPKWQSSGASRRKDGREICGNSVQLDMAIRRAGNTPLDIVISLTNPSGNRPSRKYDIKAFHGMIGFLASSRKCLQVHHLGIEGSGIRNLNWSSYWTRLEFPKFLEFPALRTFSLQSHINPLFLKNLWSTFGKPREVQLLLPYSLGSDIYPAQLLLENAKLASLSLSVAASRVESSRVAWCRVLSELE